MSSGGKDNAAAVIAGIGTDGRAAISVLLRRAYEGNSTFPLYEDAQFGYRSYVLDALAKIGPDDERVLECLASLAANRSEKFEYRGTRVARAAIAALSSIGSAQALTIIKESENP